MVVELGLALVSQLLIVLCEIRNRLAASSCDNPSRFLMVTIRNRPVGL